MRIRKRPLIVSGLAAGLFSLAFVVYRRVSAFDPHMNDDMQGVFC